MATIRINGDQVEIDNIATETTLKSLVQTMGGQVRSQNNIAENFNEAGKSATTLSSMLNIVTAGASGATKSITQFGLAAFDGTARVSTATTALKDNFGAVGSAIGAVPDAIVKGAEGYLDTFRQLSSSGAGFSADLFELKNSAAQSRLTLDEFAGIVAENSAGFAGFGGTVNKGARIFTEASKNMFDNGLADPLLNMGMSFGEINENMATYMTLNRRRFTEEEMRNGKAAQSMVLMSTEMDKIAKLTGKNRAELEKEINDRMRKGQVEAKIRMLEASGNKEAADKMRRAIAEAEKAGPGALAAVEDLFTKGAVVSEEGRAAAVALGPAFDDLTNMVAYAQGPGGIEGMTNSIDNFNTAIAQRIQDPDFLNIATLGGMGNQFADAAANLATSAGPYADNVAKVAEETGSLASAVRELRQTATAEQTPSDTTGGDVGRTLINTETALKDMGAVISDDLIGPGGALTKFIDELNGADGQLTRGGDVLADRIGAIGRTEIESAFQGLGEQLKNALVGEQRDITPEESAIISNIQSQLEKAQVGDTSGDITLTQQGINETTAMIAELVKLDQNFAANFDAILQAQEQQRPGDAEKTIESLIATVQRDGIQAAIENIGSVQTGEGDPLFNRPNTMTPAIMEQRIQDSMSPGTIGSVTGNLDILGDLIIRGNSNIVPQSQGSKAIFGGQGVLPNDMLSMLHKGERVLNASETKAFNALESGQASLGSASSANSGGTLQEKLDNLNQTMLQLVNINMQVNDTARRQLKGIKGMSGNVMTGFSV